MATLECCGSGDFDSGGDGLGGLVGAGFYGVFAGGIDAGGEGFGLGADGVEDVAGGFGDDLDDGVFDAV